jgi:hypothetical protein
MRRYRNGKEKKGRRGLRKEKKKRSRKKGRFESLRGRERKQTTRTAGGELLGL